MQILIGQILQRPSELIMKVRGSSPVKTLRCVDCVVVEEHGRSLVLLLHLITCRGSAALWSRCLCVHCPQSLHLHEVTVVLVVVTVCQTAFPDAQLTLNGSD